ncbi:MAG: DUF5987 family protein [Proteobacteria bacterium]|nr:DUF5987 family protein [Pseudomonadota bacterium]
MTTNPNNFSRREFIIKIGKFSLVLTLPLPACGGKKKTENAPVCLAALTHDEKTFSALADTIVPGCQTDPSGAPGAVEACALNLIYDDKMPIVEVATLLVSLLDGAARDLYQRDFVDLNLEERTQAVLESEKRLPLLSWLLKLIRSAFYVGYFSDIGLKYLGYPGPNLGYVNLGFSFGEKMSEELTPDGNLP